MRARQNITNSYRKDFLVWLEIKTKLEERCPPFVKNREIWWCAVGVNSGVEIDGKGERFERPILIIKKINKHSIIGIPLTSKKQVSYKPYHIKISTGSNLIVNQVRILSSKRLLRRITRLTHDEFKTIKKLFVEYIVDERPYMKHGRSRG